MFKEIRKYEIHHQNVAHKNKKQKNNMIDVYRPKYITGSIFEMQH